MAEPVAASRPEPASHDSGRAAASRDTAVTASHEAPSADLGTGMAVAGLMSRAAHLNASPRVVTQRRLADALGAAAARRANDTGLPLQLKTGLEAMSGLAMDDVRVHYHSPQPAQLAAQAFTRGSEIHVAPGQERHLAHEAWHVVQQKQGRVRPTVRHRGVGVNDDAGLEREADLKGARLAGAAPAAGATVQGRFKMAGQFFDYDRSLRQLDAALNKAPFLKDSFVQGNRAAVLAQIRAWSKSEAAEPNATSYKMLIMRARAAVARTMMASSAGEEHKFADLMPLDDDTDTEAESDVDDVKGADDRIEELAGLRRRASLSMIDLAGFRDRSQTARMHSTDTGVDYAIARTSNFMTGGGVGSGLPDDYEEIIKRLRAMYDSDQQVARVLRAALNGGKLPPPPAQGLVEKFRSLVFGPELRRAGINPTAMDAALLRVADRGGSLFKELRAGVLFVASQDETGLGQGQGGSARSQYHRDKKVKRGLKDFRKTALRERRNIRRAARRHGKGGDVAGYVDMNSKGFASQWRRSYGKPVPGTDLPATAEEQKSGAPEEDASMEPSMEASSVDASMAMDESASSGDAIRVETAPSGNCLYEGVNIYLGNGAGMDNVLRQFATDWLINHQTIALDAGVDVNTIVATLSQPGLWAGPGGDLAPYVLASAIHRNIVVHTQAVTYVITPQGGAQGGDVELYLHNAHYTVAPPSGVVFAERIHNVGESAFGGEDATMK